MPATRSLIQRQVSSISSPPPTMAFTPASNLFARPRQTNAVTWRCGQDGVSPVPRKSDDEKIKDETRTTRRTSAESADDQKKDDKSSAKDESKPGDKDRMLQRRQDKEKDKHAVRCVEIDGT